MTLLIFSLSAFAQSDEECIPPGLPSENALLKAIMAPLALWTSTGVQMQNAACKTRTPPTLREMDRVVDKNSDGPQETRTINGITLTDDPRMLKMFENFTASKNFSSIGSVCSQVSCALAKIWGSNLSRQMSYLYLHFGFNSSEYAFPNADRFTEAEMNDALMALSDFPRSLAPLARTNRQFTRYTRGKWNPDYRKGTFASSDVQVYDPWTNTNAMERQQTIFHEVTHMLTENGTLDESPEWLALSGWKQNGDNWSSSKPKCMVGKYGSKDPFEDFAETAVAFRYNPSRLYKGCPEKYQYMKKFFKGAEYFSESSCKDK